MMMMGVKRKTTCNEGRGKEVGDTEEDEVVEGAETTDEAGDEMLDRTWVETGADLTSEMKRRGRGITSKVDTVGREA